ncbi:MAG: hypothetical protein WC866_03265 [Patescibacteria group bacterium]|jgi:hypothetical protein
MKKTLSATAINRIFNVGLLFILVLFLAFLGYVYVAYSSALIGDVRSHVAPDPLKGLQTKKFQAAVDRLEARTNLPDVPAGLANPFDAPKK